jgi:hypothetical protein
MLTLFTQDTCTTAEHKCLGIWHARQVGKQLKRYYAMVLL